MLYVYKMLFRDSFYRALAWPSKTPLQSSVFYHFIESFLPSIKDDRQVQDVADG